jgi:5-methylcytosine-specific restriction protein A
MSRATTVQLPAFVVAVERAGNAQYVGNTKMTTYLLTWNPRRWDWWELEDEIAQLQEIGWLEGRWSTGVNKSIQPGDRFFLIRLGAEPRGIVGSGTIRSSSFEETHWDEERAKAGQTARYADVIFDGLLNAELDPILMIDFLKDHPVLGQMHWSQQASGVRIPDEVAQELSVHWERLLEGEYDHVASGIPEEEALFLEEGSVRQVTQTLFERNRLARQLCINHYGTQCVICGFDFELRYGEAGRGYIHVHHILPIAGIGERYIIDPIRDLRPVCPNCHAIIHRRKPVYSIEEVKALIDSENRRE